MIDTTRCEVRPLRCRRNTCGHCLPINARRRTLAITYAGPRRMLRFSHVAPAGAADPLEVARARMKRVREALRRMGVPSGHWTWTLEVNPAGTGYHAHAVQKGPSIDQAVLQEACRRGAMGYPWIRAITSTPSRVARYGLKGFGAAGYGLKSYRAQRDAMESLALNHNRLEHHTPDYFELDGRKMGVRDAESAAIREVFPGQSDSVLICDRDTAVRYLEPNSRSYLLR